MKQTTKTQKLIEDLIKTYHSDGDGSILEKNPRYDIDISIYKFDHDSHKVEFVVNADTGYVYSKINNHILHFNIESQLYKNIKQFIQDYSMSCIDKTMTD